MFEAPQARRSVTFYLLVPLIVFLLKAVILMRGGAIYGRLAMPPAYDDVSYFVDALERMRIFLDQGLSGLLRNLISSPPHAPYSTIAALLAFLFGGPYLAGPYYMNAVAMAVLTGMLFWLFRVATLSTVCITLLIVSLPWFDNSVTIFHPDFVAGFAAAVMAVTFIWQDEIVRTRTDAVMIGVAAGIILLIKPTAFIMVFGLWGLAAVIGGVLMWRQENAPRTVLDRLLFGALPILVIAGPYYLFELPGVLAYIHQGWVRERETWIPDLLHLDKMFYVNMAAANFLYWFWIGTVGSIGIVAAGGLCGDSKTALRFLGLIFVTLVAYIVPTSIDFKHLHWGAVFYGFIAMCLVLMLHFWLDRFEPTQPVARLWQWPIEQFGHWPVRLISLALLAVVAMANLGDRQGRVNVTHQQATQIEYDGVFEILRKVYRQRLTDRTAQAQRVLVYVPTPAPVSPHAYRFRGLLEGIDIDIAMSPHDNDLKVLTTVASQATVVIIPDEQQVKAIYPYPVNKLFPAFRTWLCESQKFLHVKTIRTDLGGADIFVDGSVASVLGPAQEGELVSDLGSRSEARLPIRSLPNLPPCVR
jgi:hypothetical protein